MLASPAEESLTAAVPDPQMKKYTASAEVVAEILKAKAVAPKVLPLPRCLPSVDSLRTDIISVRDRASLCSERLFRFG